MDVLGTVITYFIVNPVNALWNGLSNLVIGGVAYTAWIMGFVTLGIVLALILHFGKKD